MKPIVFGFCVAVLVFSVAAQAQVPDQPGPEEKKLEVWVGTWNIQGEIKARPSGDTLLKIDNWTLQGEWLPGGFFLLINGSIKISFVDPLRNKLSESIASWEYIYLEVLCYDSVKKTHVGYVFWLKAGTTLISTLTFKDRTLFEKNKDLHNNNKWYFSSDGMSATMEGEIEVLGTWLTIEAKAVKTPTT